MTDSKIIIEQYNPLWREMFEQEKTQLNTLLAHNVVGAIEHVGSTAVEGLAAKPIIDIMVGISDLASTKHLIPALEHLHYCYYPYKTEVMHWFCKPSPEHRTHHLHLVPFESPLWHERICFRDALREQPYLVQQYQQLKYQLAQRFADDREAYTQHKWPFIAQVLANRQTS